MITSGAISELHETFITVTKMGDVPSADVCLRGMTLMPKHFNWAGTVMVRCVA